MEAKLKPVEDNKKKHKIEKEKILLLSLYSLILSEIYLGQYQNLEP